MFFKVGARFHFGIVPAGGPRRVATAPLLHVRLYTADSSICRFGNETWHFFCHNERKDRKGFANFASEFFANFALQKGVRDVLTLRTQRQRKESRESLRPLRPLRPPYLIAVAMTFSQMTVLSMDEILLRTEISDIREEGTRRRTSERARHARGSRHPAGQHGGTEVFRTRLHASRQQFPSLFEARHSLMDEAVRKPASKSSPCPRASSRSVLTGRRPCNPPAPPQDEISPRNNLETRRAARRDGFDTCGLPGVCLGGPGTARSGHVPGSCPSLACQDLHARAKRGWRATQPSPSKKSGYCGRVTSL